MTRVSPRSIVSAVAGQVSCDLQGEAAVLEIASGMFYGFDEVGTRIWLMLQSPVRVSDITATVVQEYDVAAATCESDILAFLENLLDENLIDIKQST